MANKLLIVESPAKAKTIEKFLGNEFKVKSSYGHIRDLEKGSKGIDIEHEFQPSYIVSPDKLKVVKELKDWVNSGKFGKFDFYIKFDLSYKVKGVILCQLKQLICSVGLGD